MRDETEERIVTWLRVLRPAPPAWVEAACAIPGLEREPPQPGPDLAGDDG